MGARADAFIAAIEAMREGDIAPTIARCAADVRFEPQRSAVQGGYQGHEGIEAFWADTLQTFEVFEPTYTDVRESGDRLVAIGEIHIRGRGSGVDATIHSAAVLTFEGDLVVHYKDYGETAEALRAAEIGS